MQEYKVTVNDEGTTRWYNLEGNLHREDGPAIERSDGHKSWWINDRLHREDGPAIEWDDGTKSWWVNGKRHREDGPSVERSDGSKAWYLDGVKYTEEEWKRKVGKHTITIDGKTVEISTESYENLRKLFD